MMLVKAFIAIDVVIAAAVMDETAQRVLLYAAVAGAIGVLWRQVVKPFGLLLKHGVAVVKRTVTALDALEHLPERWRLQEERDREKDERLSAVEAEVGIVHTSVAHVANDVAAIRREFGIGDDDVRRQVVAAEPASGRPLPPAT